MTRFTQKQIRDMVKNCNAQDVSRFGCADYDNLVKEEGYFKHVGYSAGVYGCNGLLLQGAKSGKLYGVASRTSALFIFG